MARYLVTGVAGFIGSWIAKNLVSQGHEVRGLDNMTTGTCANLSAIAGPIDFHRADLRNRQELRAACEGIDGIFHEAAVASVQESIERPIETNEINHVGTLNIVEAAKAAGVRRIVFASSSAVYGNQGVPALHERLTPRPLSAYGVQKLASEHSLRVAHSVDGVETVALRYFNVFGPRQSASSPYSGVIARFLRYLAWMDQRIQPVVYGDGEQSRDFVYIEDVVSANLLAMAAPAEAAAGRVFNVGSGRSRTINSLVELLSAVCSEQLHFNHLPARSGEIRDSTAEISAAANALGFVPQWDFREALSKTLNWYRSQEPYGGDKRGKQSYPFYSAGKRLLSAKPTGPVPVRMNLIS